MEESIFENDKTEVIQTSLIGDEEIAKNDSTEIAYDTETFSGHRCNFCGSRVDVESNETYHEILSWVHGPKKDSPVLRLYTGNFACPDCINGLKSGVGPNQITIEESADVAPSKEQPIGDLPTDRSKAYKNGYDEGLSSEEPVIVGFMSANEMYDYMEGFRDGRKAKEESSSSS